MRFAYADPPYPGECRRYGHRHEEPFGCWDDLATHATLAAVLADFDGFALSTSASRLREVWNLVPDARCAGWQKTWAVNGWSRVRWTWEPVLFVTPRRNIPPGARSTTWDGLVCRPALNQWRETEQNGGEKPYEFVRWVLGLLGFVPGDTLDDLFPGSGAVGRFLNVDIPQLFDEGDRLRG